MAKSTSGYLVLSGAIAVAAAAGGCAVSSLEEEESVMAPVRAACGDAHSCFRKALESGPRSEESLVHLERTVEFDPGAEGAWYNKGVVLYNLGRYEAARAALEQAARLGSVRATILLRELRMTGHGPPIVASTVKR
jgi:tetratricopeptide (TPR) repeat protein